MAEVDRVADRLLAAQVREWKRILTVSDRDDPGVVDLLERASQLAFCPGCNPSTGETAGQCKSEAAEEPERNRHGQPPSAQVSPAEAGLRNRLSRSRHSWDSIQVPIEPLVGQGELPFPLGDRRGGNGVAEHVRGRAAHVEELVNAEDQQKAR